MDTIFVLAKFTDIQSLSLPNLAILGVIEGAFTGVVRLYGHETGDGVLVSGFYGGVALLAGTEALEPIEEMVRHGDFLDGFLAADGAFVPAAALGGEDGRIPVDHIHNADVAEDFEAVAAAVTKVR